MLKQNYLYIPPLISNNVAVHPNFFSCLCCTTHFLIHKKPTLEATSPW